MTAKPSNKHFHNNFTLPINQKPYSDIQNKTPNGPNISLTIEEKNHAKICRQFLINCHWSAKTEKNRCLTTLKLFLSLSFAYYMILRVYKSSCCCCCGVFFCSFAQCTSTKFWLDFELVLFLIFFGSISCCLSLARIRLS